MQPFTCNDCIHWHEAEELQEQAANDAETKARPGYCYAKPPSAIMVTIPGVMGQPQMGIKALRPPVTSDEFACGDFEEDGVELLNTKPN